MIYLTLLYEFFKIGLFAVGGGLATIPFLFDLTNKFDWFTKDELVSMISLSESTPGPLGFNMATFLLGNGIQRISYNQAAKQVEAAKDEQSFNNAMKKLKFQVT